MMDKKIISPCISICKTEPITGFVMAVLERMMKKIFGKKKVQPINGRKKFNRIKKE